MRIIFHVIRPYISISYKSIKQIIIEMTPATYISVNFYSSIQIIYDNIFNNVRIIYESNEK